ncbi:MULTISPECIES: hypothetical protein [unclassified Methylophilus]|jgi:hypothetical protein|uniref:Chemotaxis protein CheX n=1 Tax=Methylophilus glucosoxydans TaxID=752553 RepID=A0ABW3GM40_9PROT|nr:MULTISPECIES: hypothetical protein [unclassified Methylophilus]MBF5037963.1 hypothetical protein [Methylophilus sp. 13]MDF0376834.1 hypothetical protein [Methylophilus sp. YYY-1]MDT7850733.1 hypothetical protein [Methylophilus sp. VKM B-3414]BEV08114.1 chemotaxis protein CheX [Methylophilus sp. DW102]
MQLLPTQEMVKKISDSWSFVSGSAFNFKESQRYTFHNHDNLMAVVLPLYIDQLPQHESIAIGLILDDAEAHKIASHMFGLSSDELSDEDVKDAKKETCNIMGGGLIVDEHSELGLPKEIPLEEFFELQKTATFSRLFVSDKPNEDLVNLVIFDVNNHKFSGVFSL